MTSSGSGFWWRSANLIRLAPFSPVHSISRGAYLSVVGRSPALGGWSSRCDVSGQGPIYIACSGEAECCRRPVHHTTSVRGGFNFVASRFSSVWRCCSDCVFECCTESLGYYGVCPSLRYLSSSSGAARLWAACCVFFPPMGGLPAHPAAC